MGHLAVSMKTDGFDTAMHAPLLLHACKPASMMH
jgi:hypothetical protein